MQASRLCTVLVEVSKTTAANFETKLTFTELNLVFTELRAQIARQLTSYAVIRIIKVFHYEEGITDRMICQNTVPIFFSRE